MKFSIIIPSYNQDKFIERTLQNIRGIKEQSIKHGIEIECLLFDSESNPKTQEIIERSKDILDLIEIKKDQGQYDAINKGLDKINGDYWTWLNTDDLLDTEGFFKLAEEIKINNLPDYIYGDVKLIDENDKNISVASSGMITLQKLVNTDASISQPGSFFKTAFTKPLGKLEPYKYAFDYEFILRILKNNARVVKLPFIVSRFRYYSDSKSGSQSALFLIEQAAISKLYGRKFFSKLTFVLSLRILKRRLFN